jgi:hypothetical protein
MSDSIICDICGTKNLDKHNFCTGCGVDLRESKNVDPEKNDDVRGRIDKNPRRQQKEKNLREQFRVIKWCWLKTYEMPYVLLLISMLAQGKSRLGFCDCTICNQGYREFLAFLEFLDGKNISSQSREIVKKARDQDMSKISWDLSDILLNYSFLDDQETSRNKDTTPVQKPVAGKGKILVEIDEEIIENAVLKILQSEKGQHIIQESRTPRKKRTPKKS